MPKTYRASEKEIGDLKDLRSRATVATAKAQTAQAILSERVAEILARFGLPADYVIQENGEIKQPERRA